MAITKGRLSIQICEYMSVYVATIREWLLMKGDLYQGKYGNCSISCNRLAVYKNRKAQRGIVLVFLSNQGL